MAGWPAAIPGRRSGGNSWPRRATPPPAANSTDPPAVAGRVTPRRTHQVISGPIPTGGSVASIPYAYTVDPAASVKSIVTTGAGTGKITT
ncbi:hypothetical protein [Rugosimonospora acidiphila]|uniref:hypothetical protein n=1 Tax=Rugosimonospora acidiphila TaxID=556531 RepID=UPI0031E88EA3